MIRSLVAVFFIAFLCTSAKSDSWRYQKEKTEKQYNFGDINFTLIRDTTKNDRYPDYSLFVKKDDNLEAKYRGVAFDSIHPSKNNEMFIGFSNHGLPGTALLILGSEGQLIRELKHSHFQPNYCDESTTLSKRWVLDDPKVEFAYSKIGDKYEYIDRITFLDCHGKRVSLSDTIRDGYLNYLKNHEEREAYKAKKKSDEVGELDLKQDEQK